MNAILPILALSLATPPTPSTALRAAQPIVAKGDLKGGPPLVHTFDLTHMAATGVATITGVETSCGCLRQSLSATVLQPGETARLTIEVNTLTQPVGPNRWPVRVRFRHELPGAAAEVGEVELLLTATLTHELTLSPPQLAISASGEVTRTLTLTDRRAKPLTLLRAESTSPHLTATVGPRQEAETIITLKLAADAPAGFRDDTLVLYSDDSQYPEFRVPVRVQKRVAGGATAVPEEVSFRFAAGETESSTLVQLRPGNGPMIAIEAVECDHPAVKMKWSPGRNAVAAMRVTVTATKETERGQADVRVRLAEPAGQVVVVPVSWVK